MNIQFLYGIFGREITNYTVIYGVHIRFWPTRQLIVHGSITSTHALNRLHVTSQLFVLHVNGNVQHSNCSQ